ncbi:hypothetical protein JVT61DRAFT_9037 [Boletus reticuloceps]|uniref:C2 domain-containing protein n=1 Tax=Boletus reticuloceps TaxID=495285 RepID=A0A8I2YGP7_9AGAM|nr:hypothetical protein JVT61DRAFT_9037 [Boletus reticuloceps]
MSDSLQDVYAKYLLERHSNYGYPLRIPEPTSTLPKNYQDYGLEIGDVGTVDSKGHPLELRTHRLSGRRCKSIDNAISSGPIYSRGIKRIPQPDEISPAKYEFDTSTPAGALLILPCDVTPFELSPSEQFREMAMHSVLDWYNFAKQCYGGRHLDRSLYLVTASGFCKSRSWSLASFDNRTDGTGKIWAQRDKDNHDIYLLGSTFSSDCRHGTSRSGHRNQTIFITGFKITITSWLPDPIVQGVTESEATWSMLVRLFRACRSRLRGFSGGHKLPAVPSVDPVPSSQLSQPFHPSDIINHLLPKKNPDQRVAVTHDNDWMYMMKKGLTHEDLLHEDRLGTFLTRYCTMKRENAAVYLKVEADDTKDSISSVTDPHDLSPKLDMSDPSTSASEPEGSPPSSPELDISAPNTPRLEVSSCPTPSIDCPQIVITRIRAQNILFGRKRFPIGFYVSVQVGGTRQRTQNKSIRLNDSDIEWEDVIFLPSQAFDEVRFTVHASFELKPMLGHGETLYASGTHLRELVGGTCLITFSEGELGITNPGPSLLITLGRWYSTPLAVAPSSDDSDVIEPLYAHAHWLTVCFRQLVLEEPSKLVDETILGQEALLRYHDEYQRGDLESAVHHFECARNYPSNSQHRAVVLVNLANVKFIRYQIDPTGSDLNALSLLYDEALKLRRPGHPDRPATLLLLAQTLLFCYEKQGHTQSAADKINELMSEFRDLPEDTPERRAADLMLDTLKRCRVVNSGSLAELDKLIQQLNDNAKAHLDGYFDKPQRLINLGTTLWRRYEQRGERSDLDESLAMNEQALQLLPKWRLFEINEELRHLGKVIALGEEALQLISEGHPERPYWVASSKRHLAETLEHSGDTAFEAQKYEEAIMQYTLRL